MLDARKSGGERAWCSAGGREEEDAQSACGVCAALAGERDGKVMSIKTVL